MNRLSIFLLALLLCGCTPPCRHHSSVATSDRTEHTLLHYTGFTLQYNTSNRQPDWVEYTLTAEQVRLTENTPKVPHRFMQDPDLALPQATDEDYKGVHKQFGLTKGHMARHQDMKWSAQSVQESDYYTNISPQYEKLNTKLWKRIEDHTRKLAKMYDSVHVVCGPIFTDTANGYIGPNRIPVPDYFFKTLLIKDATGYHAIAFLCPNNDEPLTMKETACTVDEVEAMSKIDVYQYLLDKIESLVESKIDLKKWGIR
jgi:endonuclease G